MNILVKNEKNKNDLIRILSEENVDFSIVSNVIDVDANHQTEKEYQIIYQANGMMMKRIKTWNIYIMEKLYEDLP